MKPETMANERKGEILTNRQIMMVAAEISVTNMKILAEEYLKFPTEMIETIITENTDDDEAFKRSVIRRWANMNSEQQVKVETFSSPRYFQALTIFC